MLYRAFRTLEDKVAALEQDVTVGIIEALDDITALTDSSGGATANGTIEAITDLNTSNTYTDAAVNAKITLIRNAIKELATQQNAILAALKG